MPLNFLSSAKQCGLRLSLFRQEWVCNKELSGVLPSDVVGHVFVVAKKNLAHSALDRIWKNLLLESFGTILESYKFNCQNLDSNSTLCDYNLHVPVMLSPPRDTITLPEAVKDSLSVGFWGGCGGWACEAATSRTRARGKDAGTFICSNYTATTCKPATCYKLISNFNDDVIQFWYPCACAQLRKSVQSSRSSKVQRWGAVFLSWCSF